MAHRYSPLPSNQRRRGLNDSFVSVMEDQQEIVIWSRRQSTWLKRLATTAWLGVLTQVVFLFALPLDQNDMSLRNINAFFPACLLLLLAFIIHVLLLPLRQVLQSKAANGEHSSANCSLDNHTAMSTRFALLILVLLAVLVIGYVFVMTFVACANDDDATGACPARKFVAPKAPLERWMMWLMITLLKVLIPSCIALMVSFYPAFTNTPTSQVHVDENDNGQTTDEMEGLLQTESSPQVDEEEAQMVTNYQILEEVNEEISTNNDSNAEVQEDALDRIRGTRRLLQLASAQVMYLYLGCLVLLIRLPFSLSIPHFVSTTLTALGRGDFALVHQEILSLVVCGSIDAFLDFWCIFFFGYANLRIVKGLRLDLFDRLLHMEVAFFDHHHSGTLTSRLNSDCSAMASDLTWFFRFSIESVVRIIGITSYMLIRSPRLALCALSIVPTVAVVNKVYGDWLAKNASQVQDAMASTQTVAQEALSQVRTVISLGAEDHMYQSYAQRILRHYYLNVKQTFWQGVYYMAVSTFLINTVVQASLLSYGSYLVSKNQMGADVLLAFMLYQGQLQNETLNLFQSYSSLIKSSGAGDKVFALLDRRTPPPGLGHESSSRDTSYSTASSADTQEESPSSDQVAISFKQVTFRYPTRPDHPVLEALDWKVPTGKTMALVGPSGCGKSTILSLVQRLYDPLDGKVLVGGRDLRDLDLVSFRKQIGVVTQNCVLFDGTIFDNVLFGSPDASATVENVEVRRKVEVSSDLANMSEFIRTLPNGYQTQVGEGGTQLSGGQKQRLAIARAIYREPSILILDEATSALDTTSERLVQEALDRLLAQRKGRTTTLVVAHRLRTVQDADSICVLQNGKIVEEGTHTQLAERKGGIYADMLGSNNIESGS